MPSKKNYNSRFPPARIKKIMQMDEEVGKVAAPVPVIISRVLEMFVEHTLKSASLLAQQNQCRTLLSSHLCEAVASEERLHFLMETVRQHSKVEVPGPQEVVPSTVAAIATAPGGVLEDLPEGEAAADGGVRRMRNSSTPGSSGSTRGERGRGKPRGRPSRRGCAPLPVHVPSPGQGVVPVRRGRGRPKKNADPVPTSFPVPIQPACGPGPELHSGSSTAGITFSIGSSTPPTPLSAGIAVSIPTLPTTPKPPGMTGVTLSIPGGIGFSFPSPITPDSPSLDESAPDASKSASESKGAAFSIAGSSGVEGATVAVETPSGAAGGGVTVSVGSPGAKNSLSSPSVVSMGEVSVSFGSSFTPQMKKENNSSGEESSATCATPTLKLPVASLAVENSPLGPIKIEVPAYFSNTSGSNSPAVDTPGTARLEERSCASSKSSKVEDEEKNISQISKKKKKSEIFSVEHEPALKKNTFDKYTADSQTALYTMETKNFGHMKENELGKFCAKSPPVINSGVSFSNGCSSLTGKTKFLGCEAPVPSLYSFTSMYASSKVEDNSDEDYDN